jgi:multisubunit Na+/H+ antiporter MnhG subunit
VRDGGPTPGRRRGAFSTAGTTPVVAGPVGTFMLARSARIDGVRMWEGTLSDDLTDDVGEGPE